LGEYYGSLVINKNSEIGKAKTLIEELMKAFCSKEIKSMDKESLKKHYIKVISERITNIT